MELGIERIREAAPHLDEIGYRVDDLVIDVRRQRVTRGNEKIVLSPLSYELLLALLHAAPNLVSLDELMKRVWPGLVITPETVSQRVKLVRHALGDNAGSPRYIAGVRGRGYRLVAAVKAVDPSDAPGPNGAAFLVAAPPFTGSPDVRAIDPAQPSETSASQPPIRQRAALRRTLYPALGLLVAAVLVYTIIGGESLGDWLAVEEPASGTELAGNSLAVLPFANLSGDPASEHFSDGLTEEILNRLSGSKGLRVLARTSSFAYKGSGLDAQKLRDRLGVRYLLEGSVRREGRQIRVTARLVDESGFRIWSRSYQRKIRGVFAVQDEIAASVVKSVLPRLAVGEPSELPGLPNALDEPFHRLRDVELERVRRRLQRRELALQQVRRQEMLPVLHARADQPGTALEVDEPDVLTVHAQLPAVALLEHRAGQHVRSGLRQPRFNGVG